MLTVLPIIPPPSKTLHNSWLNVSRFAKRGLIHAQFQDTLIFSSLSVSHINAEAADVFNTAKGWKVCFHTGLLLKPLWRARVLRWPVNGPIFPWQADSQLWITTQLADEFGRGLSDMWRWKWHQWNSVGCLCEDVAFACHLVALCPPPPYRSASSIGYTRRTI